jgi:hypothetical protein
MAGLRGYLGTKINPAMGLNGWRVWTIRMSARAFIHHLCTARNRGVEALDDPGKGEFRELSGRPFAADCHAGVGDSCLP